MWQRSVVAVVLLALLGAASAFKPLPKPDTIPKPIADVDAAKWLLPGDVIPSQYDLKLTVSLEKFADSDFSFGGEVVISLNVLKEVDAIVLHKSVDLTITAAILSAADGTDYGKVDFGNYDNETNKLSLSVNTPTKAPKKIAAGQYTLKITYKGVHGDDMHGFYRSSYTVEGQDRWLLTTQFESYDARRAFPCFDEPQYKAKYNIQVMVHKDIVSKGYHVLSNMPLIKDSPSDGPGDMKTFTFEESIKKISSYLVAFIVSDFKPTSPATFEKTKPFVTWGQNGPIQSGEGNISQIAGPAVLDVLAGLTKVPYGYTKVDQVGIPDFAAGAMENWGLVTYRERLIFYNEANHPLSQKQSVVTVTTHELAHQWFGDLVTLHWWSDIWLNEGFATFFEYHASDKIAVTGLNTSSWKLVNQMVVDELQAGAFATDALPNSRPLTKEVYTPGEIDANFDDVAYSKGGSVIRMWMHSLGSDNFYKALEKYLNDNSENVGKPELLLKAFDDFKPAEYDIKPVEDFAAWHQQPGYPVLTLRRINESVTEIAQERYLVSPASTAPTTKWAIPITYTTSNKSDFESTVPRMIFRDAKLNITVDQGDADWILFNIQQTGVYRVNYDQAQWDALTDALVEDPSAIHEINRAQLVDDAFWLARSTLNYSTYEVALNITKYLPKEEELIPWKAALNAFNFLYGKVASHETLGPAIKNLILERIDKIFGKLTLAPKDSESHTWRLLRPLIASWACKLGQESCLNEAKDLFTGFSARTKEASPIHPDVKSIVVCTGVRNGDKDSWDIVWGAYVNASDNSEQTIYLSALGCSVDEDTLNSYLNKTLDPEGNKIRRQDLSAVFSSVYNGNPSNVAIALEFLSTNLEKIADTYGGMDPLGTLLTGIAAKLSSDDDLTKMTAIREQIEKSSNVRVLSGLTGANKAIDVVTSNKEWSAMKLDSIQEWLQENEDNAAGSLSVTLLLTLLPSIVALIYTQ